MKKGYGFIFITAFIFSTIEIVSKMIAFQINPFQMIFLRFAIGGIILIPFALKDLKSKNIRFLKEDYLYFISMAFLSIVISMSFYQLAIFYAKASTVAIVFSSNAVFTIPFAYFILKEKLDNKTIVSLILSILGLVFIFNPFGVNADFKGILFAIIAAITFSLFTVLGKRKIDYYGGITFNCITFLIGSIMNLIMLFIFKLPILEGITTHNIFHILYLGIIATCLGYLFYFTAIKETSASAASMVFFIKPALAPILSLVFLGERISFHTFVGMSLIILGSYAKIAKISTYAKA